MSDPERRALTLTLLGTGKRGAPPGPLDAGWVVRNLAGTRTTLQRWRERGVPPDRLEDFLDAVRGIIPPQAQQNAAPDIPERLEAAVERLEALLSAETSLEPIVDRIAARLGLPQSPPDEDAHEGNGALPDAEHTEQQRPG